MYILLKNIFFITPANTAGGDTSIVASFINQDRTTLSTLVCDNLRKLLKLKDGPCYGPWYSHSHLSVTNYLELFSCEQMLQFLLQEGLLPLMQNLKKGNYKKRNKNHLWHNVLKVMTELGIVYLKSLKFVTMARDSFPI